MGGKPRDLFFLASLGLSKLLFYSESAADRQNHLLLRFVHAVTAV